jgi:hypothetical protein
MLGIVALRNNASRSPSESLRLAQEGLTMQAQTRAQDAKSEAGPRSSPSSFCNSDKKPEYQLFFTFLETSFSRVVSVEGWWHGAQWWAPLASAASRLARFLKAASGRELSSSLKPLLRFPRGAFVLL